MSRSGRCVGCRRRRTPSIFTTTAARHEASPTGAKRAPRRRIRREQQRQQGQRPCSQTAGRDKSPLPGEPATPSPPSCQTCGRRRATRPRPRRHSGRRRAGASSRVETAARLPLEPLAGQAASRARMFKTFAPLMPPASPRPSSNGLRGLDETIGETRRFQA